MHPNKYFDKIYCVNLDTETERMQYCLDIFKKNNLDVTRFSAVNGKLYNEKYPLLNAGEIGCFMSHLQIIEDAKNKNYTSILIFEDDVDLIQDFTSTFSSYVKQINFEWDFLYLGGNHVQNPFLISKNILRVVETRSTHAYAIHQRAFNKILNHNQLFSLPLDLFYTKYFQSDSLCFCLYPHMAYQRAGFSAIQNKYVNYETIKQYRVPITLNNILKRPCDAVTRPLEKLRFLCKRLF